MQLVLVAPSFLLRTGFASRIPLKIRRIAVKKVVFFVDISVVLCKYVFQIVTKCMKV